MGIRTRERLEPAVERVRPRTGAQAQHRGLRAAGGGVGHAPVQVHLQGRARRRTPPRKVPTYKPANFVGGEVLLSRAGGYLGLIDFPFPSLLTGEDQRVSRGGMC